MAFFGGCSPDEEYNFAPRMCLDGGLPGANGAIAGVANEPVAALELDVVGRDVGDAGKLGRATTRLLDLSPDAVADDSERGAFLYQGVDANGGDFSRGRCGTVALRRRALANAANQLCHLRFLILDQLHTYRGRQGADVALLRAVSLRRARAQAMLKVPQQEVRLSDLRGAVTARSGDEGRFGAIGARPVGRRGGAPSG
jgi:hypothetical protein